MILTDATAADFRTAWGLSESVKIIGGNTSNLGRSDEINLYDSSARTDRSQLTYNDQANRRKSVKRSASRQLCHVANIPLRTTGGANNASTASFPWIG